jgi:hypothetical protein
MFCCLFAYKEFHGGKRVPATMSAIADAVRWAEEISGSEYAFSDEEFIPRLSRYILCLTKIVAWDRCKVIGDPIFEVSHLSFYCYFSWFDHGRDSRGRCDSRLRHFMLLSSAGDPYG